MNINQVEILGFNLRVGSHSLIEDFLLNEDLLSHASSLKDDGPVNSTKSVHDNQS